MFPALASEPPGKPPSFIFKDYKRNMTVFIALGGIPKVKNEWNLNLHLVCTFLERTEKGGRTYAIYIYIYIHFF